MPEQYGNPTHRETEKNVHTTKQSTKTSGWQQARAYGDGKGWKPHPILMAEKSTS